MAWWLLLPLELAKLLLLLSVSGDEDLLPFEGDLLRAVRSGEERCLGEEEFLGGDTGAVGRLGAAVALAGDKPRAELDCSMVLLH